MAKKHARKHHILPESYLKRFAKNKQIWQLDFELKKSNRVSIKDAATIHDFYTVKTIHKQEDDLVEQKFLSQIESLPGPVIDTIIEKHTLPKGTDWDYLANFIALMYVRGPLFRQKILEIYEHYIKKLDEHLLSDEKVWNEIMAQVKKDKDIPLDTTYQQALDAHKNCNVTVSIDRTFYVKTMMEFAAFLVPIIWKMTPNLLIAPYISDARFVTGDVPIIPIPRKPNVTGIWIDNPDFDLYFPLSSKFCLLLNYDSLKKVMQVSRRCVAFTNHLIACNCTRLLLSEEQNFVWMRENNTISTSSEELRNSSWTDEKKSLTRAKIPDTEILSECRNDWKLLRSEDTKD